MKAANYIHGGKTSTAIRIVVNQIARLGIEHNHAAGPEIKLEIGCRGKCSIRMQGEARTVIRVCESRMKMSTYRWDLR
jgi:hypothetical protein